MADFKPITLAFVRFSIAGLMMAPFLVTRYRRTRLEFKDLAAAACLGFVGFTLAYILQYIGVKMTKTMNAALEISSEPIMMMVLASLLLKEKVNPKILTGILLSTFGVLAIILPPELSAHPAEPGQYSIAGDVLVLLSAFCCALYTIIGNEAIKRQPSFVVTAYALIMGAIFLFPFSIYYENGISSASGASLKSWLCVLFLSAVATVFAYSAWYMLLEKLEASFMGNFLNLQPPVGIALGYLFLDEPVDIFTIIGAALIIGGIFITSSGASSHLKKAVPDNS